MRLIYVYFQSKSAVIDNCYIPNRILSEKVVSMLYLGGVARLLLLALLLLLSMLPLHFITLWSFLLICVLWKSTGYLLQASQAVLVLSYLKVKPPITAGWFHFPSSDNVVTLLDLHTNWKSTLCILWLSVVTGSDKLDQLICFSFSSFLSFSFPFFFCSFSQSSFFFCIFSPLSTSPVTL